MIPGCQVPGPFAGTMAAEGAAGSLNFDLLFVERNMFVVVGDAPS